MYLFLNSLGYYKNSDQQYLVKTNVNSYLFISDFSYILSNVPKILYNKRQDEFYH